MYIELYFTLYNIIKHLPIILKKLKRSMNILLRCNFLHLLPIAYFFFNQTAKLSLSMKTVKLRNLRLLSTTTYLTISKQ